jgi:hypothetical protein
MSRAKEKQHYVYEEKYFVKRPFVYNGDNYAQGDVWIPQGLPNDLKIINSGIHVTVQRIKKPFDPELEGYVKIELDDQPTMSDIAKVAGVSRATVSNVLNEKGNVADNTKDKVMQSAQKLGYQM